MNEIGQIEAVSGHELQMYIGILALKRVLSGRASGIKLKQITFTDDEVFLFYIFI